VFEPQPDVTPGLAFLDNGKTFAVGRLDGSVEFYDGEKGKRLPLPAPGLSGVEPRGLERGRPLVLTLAGTNLTTITNVTASNPGLRINLLTATNAHEAQAMAEAAVSLARGGYEISVQGPGGESGKVKVFVDDLPQLTEARATNTTRLPVSFWGTLDTPGDVDEFVFEGKAGQTVVLELAVRSVGSKLQNGYVALLDETGAVLARAGGFDGDDRLLTVRIPADGRYRARVSDQMLAASKDHFYRLAVGVLPYVTGIFPLSVGTNTEATFELAGVNLPDPGSIRVKTGAAGELTVPIDTEKFRTRRTFKALVAEGVQLVEREPNDDLPQATDLPVPAVMNGRISRPRDLDLFRFEARTGAVWVIETEAARRGSPVDTKIEILHPDGKAVARTLLQAVRNTAINFRGVDSNATGMRLDHYEEMELNEYLYLNGEVMRLFRMPQGPDSEMLMFTVGGKRRAYFDTSAVAHALDEQGFIVAPQPVDAKLAATGLPVFRVPYENDDDGERKLGSDSKLQFSAPTNGSYLVRVTDTRAHGGDTYAYRLIVRDARPDFTVTLSGANPTVNPGSGQSFTLNAERLDGFDGEIRVELAGVPPGFSVSTPIIIEAGHTEAKGSIHAALDAPRPQETNATLTRIKATAMVNGRAVTKDVKNFGTIKLGEKPKLYVSLEPYNESATNHFEPAMVSSQPVELVIAPGQMIPAWLKIKRNGHDDLVTFFAENLPHGVIVADIGLNGVLIPKGESERKIFFTADKWVPEQDRLFYMIEQQAGKQTSLPVLLKVRRPAMKQSAKAN
jgi:hypothetical protein